MVDEQPAVRPGAAHRATGLVPLSCDLSSAHRPGPPQ